MECELNVVADGNTKQSVVTDEDNEDKEEKEEGQTA